ncbi:hypothetical protein [Microbacterium sp. ZW T5_56]|uniref:hypothetical protein n=1 Tax=Microbacterium sp. ZW T5_56 TaxID=3378081 RepID=UPI00385512A6
MSGTAAVAARLRSDDWCGGMPRSASDGCASIPGFMGWALTYIQPLQDWFDELLGDPSAVASFANDWDRVAVSTRAVADQLDSDRSRLEELDGRSIRKLRERYDDLAPVIQDACEWSSATAAALRLASTIVAATREFICSMLTAAAKLWDAMFDGNPLDFFDDLRKFADAVWELVEAGKNLVDRLITALGELVSLIASLIPLLQEALDRLRVILAGMVPVMATALGAFLGGPLGAIFGNLLGGAFGDLGKDNPDVEELDPESLDAQRQRAYQDLMDRGQVGSPVDLLEQNRLIDQISGGDGTAISVQTVRRPDGSEYTLVNLPSTLDWGLLKSIMGDAAWSDVLKDYGPVNDLDSNVALVLMESIPGLKTQYERAVLNTLHDAGVAPGSDVVWSGFSQGGIMAGNLGSDPSNGYNTIGIVTNGSPTDQYQIPSHIPVLQVEHTTDPVPKLDGDPTGPYSNPWLLPPVGPPLTKPDNIDWVVMPTPTDAVDPETGEPVGMPAHNAGTYRDSLQDYINRGGTFQNDWSFLDGEITNTYVGQTHE